MNIRNGIKGERNIPGDLTGQVEKISLHQRISSLAVGLLLIIPLINTVALILLKKIGSQFISGATQGQGNLSFTGPIQYQPNQPNANRQNQLNPDQQRPAAPVNQTPVRLNPDQQRPAVPVNQAFVRLLSDNDPLVLNLRVNPAKLNVAPEIFDLSTVSAVVLGANPPINSSELLYTHFAAAFDHLQPDAILYHDQGNPITVTKARNAIRKKLIDFEDAQFYRSNYARTLKGEFDTLLKGIIHEFRNEQVPIEKKRQGFIDLASAAEHCAPRRHNALVKVYREVVNQMETVENIVLEYNQMAKEKMFDEYYSLSKEAAQTLNFIRRELDDVGLDRRPINFQDPFIDAFNDARSEENPDVKHTTKAQFRAVFDKIYTPARLIYHVRKLLNKRIAENNEFCRNISAFMNNEIGEHFARGDITDREVNHLPKPYQNGLDEPFPYHFTDAGIKFLLVHFGILNSQVPNDHLVRVTG